MYTDSTTDKTIALVAGLFEKKATADSVLAVIKPQAAKAYVQTARVFTGCMH